MKFMVVIAAVDVDKSCLSSRSAQIWSGSGRRCGWKIGSERAHAE